MSAIENHIGFLVDDIRNHGRNIDEVIDTFVDTAQGDLLNELLDSFDTIDISVPRPDLTKGWFRVRKQLAYNLLHVVVSRRLA